MRVLGGITQELGPGLEWQITLCPGQSLTASTCGMRGAFSRGASALLLVNASGAVVAVDTITARNFQAILPPPHTSGEITHTHAQQARLIVWQSA